MYAEILQSKSLSRLRNMGGQSPSPPQTRNERKSDSRSLKSQMFATNPEKKTSNISSNSLLAHGRHGQRSFNSLTKILPRMRHNGSISSSNSSTKKKKSQPKPYEPIRLPEDILTIQAHSASTPVTELPYLLIAAHIGALPSARQFYPATSATHSPLTVFRDMFVMTVDVRGYKPSSVRLSTEGHLVIIECLQSEVPQVVCTQTGTIDAHEKYIMDPTPKLTQMPVHTSFNYVQHRVKLPEDFSEEGLKVGVDDVSGHVVITGRLVHNQKSTFPEPWNKNRVVKKSRIGPIVNTSSLNLSREDARKLAAWQAVQGKVRDKSTELVNTSLLQYGRKQWLEKEGAKLRMIQHKALKSNIKKLTELKKGTPSNLPSNIDLKTPASQRQLNLMSKASSRDRFDQNQQQQLQKQQQQQQQQNREREGNSNRNRTEPAPTPEYFSESRSHFPSSSSDHHFAPTPSTSPSPNISNPMPNPNPNNFMDGNKTPKSRESHMNTKVSFQADTKNSLVRKKSKADSQKKGKKKSKSNNNDSTISPSAGVSGGKRRERGNKTPKLESTSPYQNNHDLQSPSPSDEIPDYIKEEVKNNMNFTSYGQSNMDRMRQDEFQGINQTSSRNDESSLSQHHTTTRRSNKNSPSGGMSEPTTPPNNMTENEGAIISHRGSNTYISAKPIIEEGEDEDVLKDLEINRPPGHQLNDPDEADDIVGEQDRKMWLNLLNAASLRAAKRARVKSPERS